MSAWLTHGTGVVRDDPERNIAIPADLTVPLQVQAAYNNTTMFFRYRWPAQKPGIFHDVLRYQDGEWIVEGKAVPGSQPDGLHEDRAAMMLDDGSVPEFGRYGGYVTIGDGLAGLTDEAPEEVTKYLPQTRNRLGAWDDKADDAKLAAQREAGYFLDLWHWRGGRSNPLGEADDQSVADERGGDAGKGAYSTNWDKDLNQPKVMFVSGHDTLKWDDIKAGNVTQDNTYALIPAATVPYDQNAGWQNGDVIPRRILTPGEGSRGNIGVVGEGRWTDGYWDVTLSRALDTGSPADDKILKDQGIYQVAFAIHRNATGGRWHYVSLPENLGLGRSGGITATPFQGTNPTWGDEWADVTLFYPGQVTWPMLNNANAHAGAEYIQRGVPVAFRHSPEQLANYGIEQEFKPQIKRQWLLTLLAGILLIAAFGFALNATLSTRKGA
ncbi:ethylbenzene dehydrogenase-related protein [Hoeflea sp.]|uniref:ethylbenzene dehydrogenase-related protein n=1 Tax=Hoeflea sp. TaxID=1940281 RepID=UPI0025BD9C3A|nr:ethylbenzene dehydrogenase-related protein [Hoeflea sp.]